MNFKIATLFTGLCLVASLAGCSDDDDSNDTSLSSWKVTCNVDPRTSMTVTAQVKGLNSAVTENDMMAAFVGGECRGVVKPTFAQDDSNHYFMLLVNIEQPEDDKLGQPLELYYYSAAENVIYKSANTSLTLEQDASVGSVDEPFTPVWSLQ